MNDYYYKRREHHQIDGAAYYLTFSCFQRFRLFANDQIKDRFVEHLLSLRELNWLAWVIMPEHVHAVVALSADASLADALRSIKTPFARVILNRWRTIGWAGLIDLVDEKGTHFWQEGGGFDRIVMGSECREKIAYIHRNPVRRALSIDTAEYRWSSARAFADRADYVGPPIAFGLVPRGENPLV